MEIKIQNLKFKNWNFDFEIREIEILILKLGELKFGI